MIVLVSDTSVLIDLERGQLLEPCFRLPFEFAVPDLLYKRELADYGGPQWIERGLRIEELTKDELLMVQEIRSGHARLSVPDAYAYALARSREWTLLTGDGELRQIASSCSMPFHGVLWVLDQLHDGQVMETDALIIALQAIGDHPRCRLPRSEIQARVSRYRTDGQS